MKLTILILLFSSLFGFGQEIKFTLFLKDSCTDKVEKSYDYYLEKDGVEFNKLGFDNASIILPEKGEYKLFATEVGEIHNIKIDQEINSDTLIKPRIVEYIKHLNVSYKKGTTREQMIKDGILPNYYFKSCEDLYQGVETDYYSNGTIRLTADFKNGLVMGELRRFYENGNIKEISIYDDEGILTDLTQFSENGEIIKE